MANRNWTCCIEKSVHLRLVQQCTAATAADSVRPRLVGRRATRRPFAASTARGIGPSIGDPRLSYCTSTWVVSGAPENALRSFDLLRSSATRVSECKRYLTYHSIKPSIQIKTAQLFCKTRSTLEEQTSAKAGYLAYIQVQ